MSTRQRTRRSATAHALTGFIAKFNPAIARLARSVRARLRHRIPTAVELVYDNYNALALGLGPNERTSEAFVSIAVYPRGVVLHFMHGAKLGDPKKLLQGSGKQGRFIRLEKAAQIDDPAVSALLDAAVRHGANPLPRTRRGYTVVKSISAAQRPRRPRSSR